VPHTRLLCLTLGVLPQPLLEDLAALALTEAGPLRSASAAILTWRPRRR
jgi:hypothetical protein